MKRNDGQNVDATAIACRHIYLLYWSSCYKSSFMFFFFKIVQQQLALLESSFLFDFTRTVKMSLSISINLMCIFVFVAINEPPLPRRKKCPELAYRHHDITAAPQENQSVGYDKADSANVTRARVRNFVRFLLFRCCCWCCGCLCFRFYSILCFFDWYAFNIELEYSIMCILSAQL